MAKKLTQSPWFLNVGLVKFCHRTHLPLAVDGDFVRSALPSTSLSREKRAARRLPR